MKRILSVLSPMIIALQLISVSHAKKPRYLPKNPIPPIKKLARPLGRHALTHFVLKSTPPSVRDQKVFGLTALEPVTVRPDAVFTLHGDKTAERYRGVVEKVAFKLVSISQGKLVVELLDKKQSERNWLGQKNKVQSKILRHGENFRANVNVSGLSCAYLLSFAVVDGVLEVTYSIWDKHSRL